jgi:hypothetical protein
MCRTLCWTEQVLQAEEADPGAGGWMLAKNDAVGAVMSKLDGACSVRSTGWWTYRVCHGAGIAQFHETEAGRESLTKLGCARTLLSHHQTAATHNSCVSGDFSSYRGQDSSATGFIGPHHWLRPITSHMLPWLSSHATQPSVVAQLSTPAIPG